MEDAHMTPDLLERARGGDEHAFWSLAGPHTSELRLHCYRMLGSVQDAEDMVQETMLAAWRGLVGFQGRASLRSWLYQIATNRCLNALRDAARRPQSAMPGPGFQPSAPTRTCEPLWLEPYPDTLLSDIPDTAPGPDARYERKEAVGLAFVSALQRMPPRQRASLVLRDVLGYNAPETAEMLGMSQVAVKGALQRARAALAERPAADEEDRPPLRDTLAGREVADRFADAFANGDTDAIVALLTQDALLTMPPLPLEYQGSEAITAFLAVLFSIPGAERIRLVATRANSQPAFGFYLDDVHAPVMRAGGLLVLTIRHDRISEIVRFEPSVLSRFGLPRTMPAS
jgi:RNA polymerase sigma-70 factor (TIGR02960 family)